MSDAAILLCAGSGRRMRRSVRDKILEPVLGKPVIRYSVDAFIAAGGFAQWVFVVRDDRQRREIHSVLPNNPAPACAPDWVRGGATRQESVYAGLQAVRANAGLVFIHDAARPCIQPDLLRTLRAVARRDGNATLAHRCVDTIKQTRSPAVTPRLEHLRHLDRDRLWGMETPQVFRPAEILEAYGSIIGSAQSVTDDTAAFAATGKPVSLVENPFPNPKLTRPLDLAWIELLFRQDAFRPDGKPSASSSSSSEP